MIPSPPLLSRRSLLGAGLATTLGACGGGGAYVITPSPSPSPAPVSRLQAAVAQLPAQIDALMKHTGLPGMAVAVVSGGRTVFSRGYGVRELGKNEAVDADTVFQLASVSKSLGASVVAQQVGVGRVRWDSPIQELLPWFALKDPAVTRQLTVGDLYAHRSGLPDHAGDLLEEFGFDQHTVLERLRLLPLAPFRTSYAYTNFGLTGAAVGVAAAAGLDWATLSEQVLYRPLGMHSTSSRFADFERRSNRALGHVKSGEQWRVSTGRQPDAQSPAGGVSSSVNDMARWLAMMLGQGRFEGRQVLDAASLKPAVSPQMMTGAATDTVPAGYYGFGFNVATTLSGHTAYNHSGAFMQGAATCFFILPESDAAIVALTNGIPLGVPEAVCQQFVDFVEIGAPREDWWSKYSMALTSLTQPAGELVGKSRPAAPMPPRTLSSYVGTYENDYYGPLQVVLEGGVLQFLLGPGRKRHALEPWDGDLFVSHVGDEAWPPGSITKLLFAGNRLTVELLDDEGFGTFVRG